MSDVIVAPRERPGPSMAHILEIPGRVPVGAGGVEIVDEDDPPPSVVIETDDVAITVTQDDMIGGLGAGAEEIEREKFDENLADKMDDGALAVLSEFLIQGVEDDLRSRVDWEDTANKVADYLGVKIEEPTTTVTVDGTVCKMVATCMIEAAVKLWGVARAELLPANGPVRVKRDTAAAAGRRAARDMGAPGLTSPSPTPGGLATLLPEAEEDLDAGDDALADALQQDMNHFLTRTDREYYPDFSRMLFSRILIGNAFRKVYRCPIRRRPASVWVRAQDLIVSPDCTHLSGASRITERIRMSQGTMRRLQKTGHYRDIDLIQPLGEPTATERAVADSEGIDPTPKQPWDADHQVYECYVELDSRSFPGSMGDMDVLDRDEEGHVPGYPLPYRVSIDKDSRQVLEVRRNWRRGDRDYRPRRRYVKYGSIPGLGFYDYGLIHLVGNPTLYASMLQRAMTDATLYANFPGGIWLQNGARNPQTVIRPNPGQWIGVNGNGATKAQDIFMPLPYRAPGAEEMALLTKMEGDVSRIAGIVSLPLGEAGLSNVPVGTIMSYMEQVTQVPGAIHKDDHISQADEFELLRELFAEDPEALWRGRKSPARRWAVRQEIEDRDLIPAADPNVPSQQHRIMRTQALVAASGSPQFQGIANQRGIWANVLKVLGMENPEELTVPPTPPGPPAPDPKLMAAQIKAQTEKDKGQQRMQAEELKHDGDMKELAAKAADNAANRQAELTKVAAQAGVEEMRVNAEAARDAAKRMHETVNATADRTQEQAQHQDQMQEARAARFTQAFAETPKDNG